MHDPHLIFQNPERYLDYMTSENPEGYYFDRKEVRNSNSKELEAIREKIYKTISAFTNSKGGILVLGIANDGQIIGLNDLSEQESISLVKTCDDNLVNHYAISKEYKVEEKKILLIYAREGRAGICETNNVKGELKAWKREGANSLPLTKQDRERLIIERNTNFELLTVCEYDFSLINKTVYELFKRLYIEEKGINFSTDESFLENLVACKRENGVLKFTNAGYLFFANNPRGYIAAAAVRFFKHDADYTLEPEPTTIIFHIDIDGCLPEMLRKIRTFLKTSPYFKTYTYRKFNQLGIIEETEYPINAVEEAIVNALIHRDYNSNQPIECRAFRDAFTVKSSGGLLQENFIKNEFILGEFQLISHTRNPKLAYWANMMKDESGQRFVKLFAEGTNKMLAEMQKMKLPPPHYKTNGFTKVTFQNKYKEREEEYYAQQYSPIPLAHEFCNLYKISIFSNNDENTNYDLKDVRQQVITLLKDKLQNSNWFIDSEYGLRVVAHQKGKYIDLKSNATAFLQIFPAYTFQIYWIGSDLYLSVDYDIQIKSITNLSILSGLGVFDFRHRKALAKYGNTWTFAEIQDTTEYYARVFLPEFEKEEEILTKNIIPNLKNSEIKTVLRKNSIYFDLDKQIKEYSLANQTNAAKERYQKISEMVKVIAREMFPLRYNGYTTQVTEIPVALNEANMQISDAILQNFAMYHLPEPKVKFQDNFVEDKIANGLTKFGGFNTKSNVEIIPFCVGGFENKMTNLLKALQTGSATFKGAGKTFATQIKYTSIIAKPQATDFLEECKRLLQQNPTWEGNNNLDRLFLIHIPQNDYDVYDIHSPYYVLKEYLLEKGIPVQMLDSDTLNKTDYKDLNLALNIVAKTGGIPWVLPNELPDADVFIGLSYSQYKTKEQLYRTMGYANVFTKYGEWKYYKGNASAFSYDERDKYFYELVVDTMKALENEISESPAVHIHYSAKFSKKNKAAILKAVQSIRPKAKVTFVWLNSGHNIRMFDNRMEGNGSLARGNYVTTSPRQFYLSTTGYNTLRKSLGTAIMLEVNVNTEPQQAGQLTQFKTIAQHLLALTKLNWASSQSINAEPVTIKYARSIAQLSKVFLLRRGEFRLHKVLEKTPWFI